MKSIIAGALAALLALTPAAAQTVPDTPERRALLNESRLYWGPFWETVQYHHDQRDRIDATGRTAREFLETHRAACMERRGTWVRVKEDVPFCRCESQRAVCDALSAQSWFYGPARAEASASASASVGQEPPAPAAAGASAEADAPSPGREADVSGRMTIACSSGGTTEVGKRVDCRLRVPGRIQEVKSVDWQVSPTDAEGCQVSGLSEIGKPSYAFEPRCAGDYRVQARAYGADDTLIGQAARNLHSDLVPPEAGLEEATEVEEAEDGPAGISWGKLAALGIIGAGAALAFGLVKSRSGGDGPDTIVIEPRP